MTDIAQISSQDAYALLQDRQDAVLVDVRTQAEWAFVGIPDLGDGRRPVMLSWQVFPSMAVDPDFAGKLEAMLGGADADRDTPLLFLCRSGGRSQAAATAMAAAGFTNCANIADGFEGQLDARRQRGRVDGWKASGLPWMQS